MDDKERQRLIIKRKKEQKERERLKDFHRDLTIKQKKAHIENIQEEEYNKLTVNLIIFFGTLMPLTLFYWVCLLLLKFTTGLTLSMLGPRYAWINPVIHILFFGLALISVVRGKSVLDDYLFRWYQ